ncbi:MAG: TPR end-of-group domain-containing protein, partial [Planctomycetota bacterium]
MRPSIPCLSAVLILAAFAGAATDRPPALVAYQASEEGREHEQAGRWTEAARSWRSVCEQNPFNWYAAWRHATALYRLERYDEAGDAYRRSWELGGIAQQHDAAIYNAACSYSLAGRIDEAFEALAVAMTTELGTDTELLRTDTDLDALRDDPRFPEIVPIDPPPGLTRDKAWVHDLDVFERRMKAMHYQLDAVTPLPELERAIETLRSRV